MAETDFQLIPVTYARDALRDHFRGRTDVYVPANLFVYITQVEADVAPLKNDVGSLKGSHLEMRVHRSIRS